MDLMRKTLIVLFSLFFVAGFIDSALAQMSSPKKQTADLDRKRVDRGRYLSQIGGCNDCHTPGYLLNEGKVPESLWLTGTNFGWRGPWGTTYPSNLRMFVTALTEDQWVAAARVLKAKPPMPWFTLNIMHDEDLRAIYQFIRHLGPGGVPAPAYVPPDQEPKTPYALFPSPPREGHK